MHSTRVIKGLARAGTLALFLLLLLASVSGCNPFISTVEAPLELNYRQTLPADWTPVGTWREVNIDDDDDTEYLLLYTYDQGQVGGAIYDAQISPDLVGVVDVSATPVATPTVTLVPVPLQPLAYYRPYRLLPTSWSYAYGGNVGHGFFARPEDQDNITVVRIVPPGPEGDGAEPEGDEADLASQPASELLILGGDTHMTFVWWLNDLHGYAISQLTAEAGFPGINSLISTGVAPPIETVSGLDPLTDYRARSRLCRETRYTRDYTATHEYIQTEDTPTIAFDTEYRGLTFCDLSVEPNPYYPEGVVMKFLGVINADAPAAEIALSLERLLTPGTELDGIELEAGVLSLTEEMISDIAAYPTVPALPPRIVTGDFFPTTTVCVEATQREELESRWILYTLRYQPPDLETRRADRWTISKAEEMPQLADQQSPYQCESLLNATVE